MLESDFKRNGRYMLASAKQVDFNQVDLTFEQLFLFASVELSTLLATRFVRQAQKLDRGDEPFAFVSARVDFDERFSELVMCDFHRHRTCRESADNGRGTPASG